LRHSLSVIAIVLSALALVLSLVQIAIFLPRTPAAFPSFDISRFETSETFTKIQIYNNGTERVDNIRVLLIYESPDPTSPLRQLAFPTTVYIPGLPPGRYQFTDVLVPIGKAQLRTQTQNIADYVADVWISCENSYPGMHFTFNVND
jgi:hypothetical protein